MRVSRYVISEYLGSSHLTIYLTETDYYHHPPRFIFESFPSPSFFVAVSSLAQSSRCFCRLKVESPIRTREPCLISASMLAYRALTGVGGTPARCVLSIEVPEYDDSGTSNEAIINHYSAKISLTSGLNLPIQGPRASNHHHILFITKSPAPKKAKFEEAEVHHEGVRWSETRLRF